MSKVPFLVKKISDTILCVEEQDRYGQEPLMYVVFGEERAALIDTGCNTANLLQFLRGPFLEHCSEERKNLVCDKLIIIITHCHFDHVSGCHHFSPSDGPLQKGVLELCMSGADPEFSQDRFGSLGWYYGCEVKPYRVTKWLNDGEIINLSSEYGTIGEHSATLEVVHAPGHTPDSMCLYYRKERRLFVGDVFYLTCAIVVEGPKSCPIEFEKSNRKLIEFIRKEAAVFGGDLSKIALSCGHDSHDIDGTWLDKFGNFLQKVNTNKIKSKASCCDITDKYENEDKSLSIEIRKCRWADDIFLMPIMKKIFGGKI